MSCSDVFYFAHVDRSFRVKIRPLHLFFSMVSSRLLCWSGKSVGLLLLIIFCVRSEVHLENANNLAENRSFEETNKAVVESDLEGEKILLEVLGDDDFDHV